MSAPNPAPGEQPATSLHLERRAYVRLAVELAATCRPPGRGREVGWAGRVRDISRGGVGLLLRHRFRRGTLLAVDLRASTGTLLRTVTVRVAHATPACIEGVHYWHLGCAFDEPLTEVELEDLR